MARVPRNVAGVVGFGASVAGAYLIYRGLWEVQPLVTFGELPTPSEVKHGRELLAVASAVTLSAGAIVAAAGARLNGALVAFARARRIAADLHRPGQPRSRLGGTRAELDRNRRRAPHRQSQ